MLVPVGVHFLYDFSALFLTWLAASRDANDRAQRAEQIMRANSGATLCTRSLVIVPVPVLAPVCLHPLLMFVVC